MLVANEPVPFRFTPNMQEFMTEVGMEGLLTAGINAIARCLTEPEVRIRSFPPVLSVNLIIAHPVRHGAAVRSVLAG